MRAALLARAATLRPSLLRPVPADVGYSLGSARGVECWSSVEDSMIVLGPPRSGKGYNIVIPMLLDAPGAVITTATRADNLSATITARAAHGPVGVFDPEGLAAGVPSALRWSPVRGCERPQTAMIRANALCAESAGGTESGSFWKQQTTMAVRCLLHAAALEDRAPVDLYRWSLSPAAAKEAVDILVHAPERHSPGTRRSMPSSRPTSVNAIRCGPWWPTPSPLWPTPVSSTPSHRVPARRSTRPNSFASAAPCTCSVRRRGPAQPPDWWPPWSKTWWTWPAVSLLGSTGARLDPPLGLILDEAANYPLPSLGALMSEGGGTGITTLAVLQSLAQARHRWGREQAQGIWDSAIVKIVLGGGSNADDLADIARLVGDRTEREFSQTAQSGGGRSISTSNRERAILDPSAIRSITPGHGLAAVAFGATDHAHAAPVDGPPRCRAVATRPGRGRRCHSKRRRTRAGRAVRKSPARTCRGRRVAFIAGPPTATTWPASNGLRSESVGRRTGSSTARHRTTLPHLRRRMVAL